MPLADGHSLEADRVREALHAVRLALHRLRVRLAGLGHRFRAHSVLGACERQHVAELGRIEHGRGMEAQQQACIELERGERGDSIAVDIDRRELRAQMHVKPLRVDVRSKHRVDHVDCDARLEREPRHPAVARIELGTPSGIAGRGAIPVAQRIAQRVIAARAAEALDVLVLVECGNALRGQLSAEPVGLLDHMYDAAAARGGERCGDAAGAAADDQHIAFDVLRRATIRQRDDGDRRIAARRHAHHIDQLVDRSPHRVATHWLIRPGSQSTICGKAITTPSTTSCMPR